MTPNIAGIVKSPIALAVVAGAGMWFLLRPKDAGNLAAKVGAGIINVTGDVFQGVVAGVTGGIVPVTSESECCSAIAAQRANETYLGAFKISGVCPASDYLKWAFTGKGPCDNTAPNTYIPPEPSPGSVLSGGGIVDDTSFNSTQCGLFDFYCNDAVNGYLDFYDYQNPSFTSVAGIRG